MQVDWLSYGTAPSPQTIFMRCWPGRSVAWCCTEPLVAAAETARFIIHGSRGSYVKYGLDPQEERLKSGERLPQEDWGYDMRDGLLTRAEGEEITEESWLTLPGNYPAYYAAIRDALNGIGVNPVPASQAIQIMELIELGLESAVHRATLCLN